MPIGSAAEFFASPDSAGVDPRLLDALVQRARREVDEGLLPSAQIAVARQGRLVLFETFGDAGNETLYCVFSCTKAITSAAVWLLIERGRLRLDECAAEVVPEFGANGKQAVSVEHLLLHTAGFPNAPFDPLEWPDRSRRLARFASWRLDWPPGSRFAYHATSGMWVLAEIIERRSGRSFEAFVREEIAEPLGLGDLHLGLAPQHTARVAELTHCGTPPGAEDYARLGLAEPPQAALTEQAILGFNRPEVRAVPVPGAGGIMTAAELALFYQALLHGGSCGGRRIWKDETLALARTVRSGAHVDPLTGQRVNRGLGIVVAGGAERGWRGFGQANSSLAFGHGGAGGQIAWADPASGVSLGYCTNGHDRNSLRSARRGVSISHRAARIAASVPASASPAVAGISTATL